MKTLDGYLKSQLAKFGSMCFHLGKIILLLFNYKWMAIIYLNLLKLLESLLYTSFSL